MTLNRVHSCVFLSLIFVLMGCVSFEGTQSMITQELPIISSPTPRPIVTPAPATPTITQATKLNPDPSVLQTRTSVPSITKTPPTYTPGPTYSPAEEEAYWIEMISSKESCELPCWWGITPGKSPEHDLLVLYRPWGLNKWYPWPTSNVLEEQVYPLHVNQFNSLNLALTVYTQSGIVQRISILADNLEIFPDFAKAMRRYSLSNVLLRHGKPSRVLFLIDRQIEANAPRVYYFWVFYDQLGTLVFYSGEGWTSIGYNIRICSSFEEVRYIQFYLQSPESDIPLENIFSGGLGPMALDATIEKMTNLNLDDFYNEFVDENRKSCFETPYNIWP